MTLKLAESWVVTGWVGWVLVKGDWLLVGVGDERMSWMDGAAGTTTAMRCTPQLMSSCRRERRRAEQPWSQGRGRRQGGQRAPMQAYLGGTWVPGDNRVQ